MLNFRDYFFHDFDTLANIAENVYTRNKPDIQYINYDVYKENIAFEFETK